VPPTKKNASSLFFVFIQHTKKSGCVAFFFSCEELGVARRQPPPPFFLFYFLPPSTSHSTFKDTKKKKMGETAAVPAQHISEARRFAEYALHRAEARGRSIEDDSVVVVWVDSTPDAAGVGWLRVRVLTPGHVSEGGGGSELEMWRACFAGTGADMVPVICIFKTHLHVFRVQRGSVCGAAA
jgi:hypothetical protein